MLNKPTHEVELVLFGTTGGTVHLHSVLQHSSIILTNRLQRACTPAETDNPLNVELGEDQYANIVVQQELAPPNLQFLTSILSLSQASGSAIPSYLV